MLHASAAARSTPTLIPSRCPLRPALLQMHDDLSRERGKAQELQKQVLDQARRAGTLPACPLGSAFRPLARMHPAD